MLKPLLRSFRLNAFTFRQIPVNLPGARTWFKHGGRSSKYGAKGNEDNQADAGGALGTELGVANGYQNFLSGTSNITMLPGAGDGARRACRQHHSWVESRQVVWELESGEARGAEENVTSARHSHWSAAETIPGVILATHQLIPC